MTKRQKAWKLFTRFMRSIKLFNWNNELSLTNIAFYIVLYKIALTDMATMSVADLATSLSVLGLYFGKKILNKVTGQQTTDKDESENEVP